MDYPESGTNIHCFILRQHGRDVLHLLRKLEKVVDKLARWRNHLIFNIRCRRTNITPKTLQIKSPINGEKAKDVLHRTEQKLLNIRISQCTFTIRKLCDEKTKLEEDLYQKVGNNWITLQSYIQSAYERKFNSVKDAQRQKFTRMKEEKCQKGLTSNSSTFNKDRWVKNLSERSLNKDEEEVLKLGLNFAVTPTKIPVSEIIASTELACLSLDASTSSRLRSDVTKVLKTAKPPKPNITLPQRTALDSLKKDQNITILPADKGRVTVIMDKSAYEEKIDNLLKDTSTYQQLKSDPTAKYKTRLTQCLKRLKDEKKLSHKEWKKLYPTSEEHPKFYGLPKVHKQDIPLRPIVSSIGSLTYQTARHLANILGPLVGKTIHHIKNSGDFIKKIKDLEVPPARKMVSFDVTALFTSIPVPDAIQATKEHLEKDQTWTKLTNLTKEDILDLLNICLSTTYFVYQGKFFQQIKGAAMGSPISPIIANIYMEKFEKLAIQSAKTPPKCWLRYVDDTFCVLHIYDVEDFTKHLNSLDNNIKFTVEVEDDNKLAFLDTCIQLQDDGSLKTSVYRKATHTDQYLNFRSNHPTEHKRSVVRTLYHRAETIVSDEDQKKGEIQHIRQALSANGYSGWILKAPEKSKKTQANKTQPAKKVAVGLPYLKGLSEHLQRTFKQHGVSVYHKPINTIRSHLVHPKDKSDPNKRAGIVYDIRCGTCDQHYIGETGRPMNKRMDEHRKLNNSAVFEHCSQTGHSIDWPATRVLDKEPHEYKRKVKEAIKIRQQQPALNRDAGLDLPAIYNHILSLN